MILGNGEFAIDGYRFGCGHHANVKTLQATSIRWRVQDQSNPVGDNVLMGNDFGDPSRSSWDCSSRTLRQRSWLRRRRNSPMPGPVLGTVDPVRSQSSRSGSTVVLSGPTVAHVTWTSTTPSCSPVATPRALPYSIARTCCSTAILTQAGVGKSHCLSPRHNRRASNPP